MTGQWVIEQLEAEDVSSPPKLRFSPEKINFVRGVTDVMEIYSGGHHSATVLTQGQIKTVELCETGTPYVTDVQQISVPPGKLTSKGVDVSCLVIAWDNRQGKSGIVITTLSDYFLRVRTDFIPTQLVVYNNTLLVAGGPHLYSLRLSQDEEVSLEQVRLNIDIQDSVIGVTEIHEGLVTLHESGKLRYWSTPSSDSQFNLIMEREVVLTSISDISSLKLFPSCSEQYCVWVTSSDKSLMLSFSPWVTNSIVHSTPPAVTIVGDMSTGVDVLFGFNMFAVAYSRGQAHDVDFSCVSEGGVFVPFKAAVVIPLPLSFSKIGFRAYRDSGCTTYEVTTSSYMSLRSLSDISVLGAERSVALRLLDQQSDAPISSLLSLLVEKRLSQHIVTWLSECQIDSSNDVAVIKGVILWLTDLVKVFKHTISECCSSLENGSWSPAHQTEAHGVREKLPQCSAIIETMCEIESNTSITSLKKMLFDVETMQIQVQHMLWMSSALSNETISYDIMKTCVLELENKRMSLLDSSFPDSGLNSFNIILSEVNTSLSDDQRSDMEIVQLMEYISSLDSQKRSSPPAGLSERLRQLHKTIDEHENRFVLSFDILSKYAILSGGQGNDEEFQDLFDKDTGCLRVQRLFVVPQQVLLPVGEKVEFAVPIGAGWSSAVIIEHNKNDTFDVKTGDGCIHQDVPYSNSVNKGSSCVDAGTQCLLQKSLFYLFLLIVDQSGKLADDYATYVGGLNREWVHFLKCLWAVDFGSKSDMAKRPLHLPTQQCLAGIASNNFSDLSELQVISSCATDCALNSASLLWSYVGISSDQRGFVSLFDSLLMYGNKLLYPKRGVSTMFFAHILSLVSSGECGMAMEVVRKIKVPFGAALVLHYVLRLGIDPTPVLTFPVSVAEQSSIEQYIIKLRDIQRLDKAALKSPLSSVDSTKLLIAFSHARHKYHDMYSVCLQASDRLDLLPLKNQLETIIPPIQQKSAQKHVQNLQSASSICNAFIPSTPIINASEKQSQGEQISTTAGYTRNM